MIDPRRDHRVATSLFTARVQSRETVVMVSNEAAVVTILIEILALLIAWGIYPLIFGNSPRN
ncbi:hypothetical protein C6I20_13990 [Aeromicrobium sp. A1-2]|nr:hypothetical protein C6I20_13990 [Aeromicrobium sp. A1-2]